MTGADPAVKNRRDARRAAPRPTGNMFRNLRIFLLVLVLFAVTLKTWEERYQSTRWIAPLFVAIYRRA